MTERHDGATGAVVGSDRYDVALPEIDEGSGGSFGFLLVGVSALADGDGDGGREPGVYSLALAASFDKDFELVDEAATSGAEYRALATGRCSWPRAPTPSASCYPPAATSTATDWPTCSARPSPSTPPYPARAPAYVWSTVRGCGRWTTSSRSRPATRTARPAMS